MIHVRSDCLLRVFEKHHERKSRLTFVLQIRSEETRSKRRIRSRLHQKISSRRPRRWIPSPLQTPSASVPRYLPRYFPDLKWLIVTDCLGAVPSCEACIMWIPERCIGPACTVFISYASCSKRVTSQAATHSLQATQNPKGPVGFISVFSHSTTTTKNMTIKHISLYFLNILALSILLNVMFSVLLADVKQSLILKTVWPWQLTFSLSLK